MKRYILDHFAKFFSATKYLIGVLKGPKEFTKGGKVISIRKTIIYASLCIVRASSQAALNAYSIPDRVKHKRLLMY